VAPIDEKTGLPIYRQIPAKQTNNSTAQNTKNDTKTEDNIDSEN
jgi:hypothetical protein